MNIQHFAQKGIVINDKDEILMIRYIDSEYQSDKVAGKYALPGGRIEFGETPDQSIIREIKEESGVICNPGMPVYCWNWEYKKGDDWVQINAVARICKYVSGELTKNIDEGESTIEGSYWIPRDKVLSLDIVLDELPALKLFISFQY